MFIEEARVDFPFFSLLFLAIPDNFSSKYKLISPMVWYTFGLFAENWQSSGPSSTNYDKTLILTNSNLKKFALSNLYTPLKPRL